MRRLIDEAIEANLDGLVVSLPDVEGAARPRSGAPRRAGIPVDLDQLGQRPLPRARDPRPRRPARVPRRLRGGPADGEGRACATCCASTRRSATPASTSAAAASATALRRSGGRTRGARRRHPGPDAGAAPDRAGGPRQATSTGSSRSAPRGAVPALAALRAAGFGAPRQARHVRPLAGGAGGACGSGGCCSRSTSSRTCRATCRSCCSPSARATCCSRRAAS